jgi:hypothetical protein
MLLSELGIDALAIIFSLVKVDDLSRLRECGSALLTAKMVQIVREVRLLAAPLQKFPLSLFSWPHITSVLIQEVEYASYYPLALNHRLPLPLTPVPTLQKLVLSFAQSFSVLVLKDGTPLLETIFPLIKNIKLSNSTRLLNEDHMKALPRTLEKIRLSSMYCSARANRLPFSILDDLPPNLKKLSMYVSYIEPEQETKTYNSVQWPVGLRYLHLRLCSPQILFCLPRGLEYLNLEFTRTPETRDPENFVMGDVSTSLLPASLITCHINGFRYDSQEGVKSEAYPPNLKVLSTQLLFNSHAAEQMALLPKSLTSIRLPAAVFETVNVTELLPNLEEISIVGVWPQRFWQNLPPNLRDFYQQSNESCLLAEIPSLPPRLINLGVRLSAEEADLKKIPPSVQSLEITIVSGTLSPSLVDLLPPHLTSLTINLHACESKEVFSHMPKTLLSLELVVQSACPASLYSDPTLLDQAPSNMTVLILAIAIGGTAWSDWIKRLSSTFPKLDSLFLFLEDEVVQEEEPWPMDFMLHIPPGVTDLYVPIGNSSLEPGMMTNLPKGLRSLQFSSSRRLNPQASDECFANLPSTLISFALPSNLTGISPNIIDIIPSAVVSLSLPTSFHKLYETYYSRPIWEGYSYYLNKPQTW